MNILDLLALTAVPHDAECLPEGLGDDLVGWKSTPPTPFEMAWNAGWSFDPDNVYWDVMA